MTFLRSQFVTHVCDSKCECFNETMICHKGNIPDFVPSHVVQLTLRLKGFGKLEHPEVRRLIGNWFHIRKLIISADYGLFIKTHMFQTLTNLHYLEIQGYNFLGIKNLHGLSSLQILNLSSNCNLNPNKMYEAFLDLEENSIVLPKLRKLYLLDINNCAAHPQLIAEQFYFAIASGRNIHVLDISGCNILHSLSDLLKHFSYCLEKLIAQRIAFTLSKDNVNFHSIQTYPNLKYLDLTGSTLLAKHVPSRLHTSIQLFFLIFPNTEVVILDNFKLLCGRLPSHIGLITHELDIDLSQIPVKISHLSCTDCLLKVINAHLTVNKTTHQTFQTINLSKNRLEMISPNFFTSLVNLTSLNLSHNALRDTSRNIFSNNAHLITLDLSDNEFHRITFETTHLENLKYLSLAGNKIIILDTNTQKQVVDLFLRQRFMLDLSRNPFQCTCEKEPKEFLSWIKAPYIISKPSKHYLCELNGETKDILTTAIEDTEKYCQESRMKAILTIGLPITCVVLIIMASSLCLLRKEFKRRQRKREFFRQIQNMDLPNRFLVFLCYCSEDSQFVSNNIIRNLNNSLHEVTKKAQKLVCNGDQDFRPGFYIFDEALRLMQDSSVVLAVI